MFIRTKNDENQSRNGLDMANFTIERLRDSFVDCLGQCGNLLSSFEPKITRISQEMGYIRAFSSLEVA